MGWVIEPLPDTPVPSPLFPPLITADIPSPMNLSSIPPFPAPALNRRDCLSQLSPSTLPPPVLPGSCLAITARLPVSLGVSLPETLLRPSRSPGGSFTW